MIDQHVPTAPDAHDERKNDQLAPLNKVKVKHRGGNDAETGPFDRKGKKN